MEFLILRFGLAGLQFVCFYGVQLWFFHLVDLMFAACFVSSFNQQLSGLTFHIPY